METDWENLTDPILLSVFSFLDKHELNSICRTCKNWYRIAQDESLWKRLIFRNFGCRYSRHDESWKSEVKRLTYHVPKRLHQTCLSHVDEIYYVCFSNSGKLIATCGADGNVKVWQYGNSTELLHSRQVLDPPSYANYVEFNEAETQVLVNCNVRVNGDLQAILAVLSIEKGLAIVAARNSWFPNFRGTWLHNDTFLIADVLAFFFSNANVKLVACTFYDDLDDPVLLDRPLGEHLEDDNVELRPILEMERDEEYRPHFVKVIDWSKWNQDNLIEHNPNFNLNEKVIILFQESLELDIVHRVVFYKLDVDCEVPNVAEPIKIIVINSGCMGVQLSADHRDIVYNFRRIYVAGDNSCHEKDVHTMAINLASTEEKPEIFTENKALEESSTLFYFFPSISSDFIASGSEQDVAFLWDRHSKLVIAQLPHKLSDPNAQNGVNGVAFHPHDQEVLVSVADDCKLRIWMSANRENHLE